MVRAGYGGREVSNGDGTFRGIHCYLISSPLVVMPEVTNFPLNEKTVPEMLQIYRDYRDESIHRWAWRTDEEMQQFRREMREIVIPPLMSRK
jgi:hypothetical protein